MSRQWFLLSRCRNLAVIRHFRCPLKARPRAVGHFAPLFHPDCLRQEDLRRRPMVSFARYPAKGFRSERAQRINRKLICPNFQKDASVHPMGTAAGKMPSRGRCSFGRDLLRFCFAGCLVFNRFFRNSYARQRMRIRHTNLAEHVIYLRKCFRSVVSREAYSRVAISLWEV